MWGYGAMGIWGHGDMGPACTALLSPSVPTEPHFVASAYIQESAGSSTGDDDKVYFFFSERAVEYDCYAEQVVARVARVCKVWGGTMGWGAARGGRPYRGLRGMGRLFKEWGSGR